METILNKLSSSLNRRDEIPNQELATNIAKSKNKGAVKELVENLINKKKEIQSDCIKVLYEIGERNPILIADYADDFIKLLNSSNNRMVWGAMSAIDTIALIKPEEILKALPMLMDIANKGTVITKDRMVGTLIKLCTKKEYHDSAFPLFIELLSGCPTNQLPMYAENALPVISNENKGVFVKILTSRLDEIEKETKRKKVEKVIKKVG